MMMIIIEYMMIIIYIVNRTERESFERKPMKVSREQAARNRDRVIAAAARLFRERGFDHVAVADVMKSAGLTHGGFYGQFDSKADLAAEACRRSVAKTLERWDKLAGESADEPLAAVIDAYLSPQHRDDPGRGCLLAALGPEIARQDPTLRHIVTEGLRALIDGLGKLIPNRSKAARRRKALALFSGMVGAIVLARAVDDPALSEEILRATEATLTPQVS
ncbi:TetR family transcriptional regulator [Hypericibacter adhaerens]|uniref:TetR family transcriptional regulator n=2 Tax=Hypericibacter adhaerens TaxID=2602016 RepID=A0A5J6N1D2_9PROT|nr:TetR family transcriptional regulator [Hypericibacter adhaerens]